MATQANAISQRMTKSELIERIVARNGDIHPEDVRIAINALVGAMATALAAGRIKCHASKGRRLLTAMGRYG
jgi:hypothetical protein